MSFRGSSSIQNTQLLMWLVATGRNAVDACDEAKIFDLFKAASTISDWLEGKENGQLGAALRASHCSEEYATMSGRKIVDNAMKSSRTLMEMILKLDSAAAMKRVVNAQLDEYGQYISGSVAGLSRIGYELRELFGQGCMILAVEPIAGSAASLLALIAQLCYEGTNVGSDACVPWVVIEFVRISCEHNDGAPGAKILELIEPRDADCDDIRFFKSVIKLATDAVTYFSGQVPSSRDALAALMESEPVRSHYLLH